MAFALTSFASVVDKLNGLFGQMRFQDEYKDSHPLFMPKNYQDLSKDVREQVINVYGRGRRQDQVAIFVTLIASLDELIKQNSDKTDIPGFARRVLYGALIYRMYRIEAEYKVWSSENSKLYNELKTVLAVKCAREIDPYFKFACCSALQDFMAYKEANGKPRVENYSFSDASEFFRRVGNIIAASKIKHDALLPAILSLNFISSLKFHVETIHQECSNALDAAKKPPLVFTNARLALLLSLKPVKDKLSKLDVQSGLNDQQRHEAKIEFLRTLLDSMSRHALLGASLLMMHQESVPADLKVLMKNVLGLEAEIEHKHMAMKLLNTWILEPGDFMHLPADIWDGRIELFKIRAIALQGEYETAKTSVPAPC